MTYLVVEITERVIRPYSGYSLIRKRCTDRYMTFMQQVLIYDPKSSESIAFFNMVQNKLH